MNSTLRRAVALGCSVSVTSGLAIASVAGAQGGTGGGGGGTPVACLPLTTTVGVAHSDSGESGVAVTATVRNCSNATEALRLNVSVPGSGTKAFAYSTALPAGASFTRIASPIGSTPLLLHYGQTYNVVQSLVESAPVPQTLSTIKTSVTMPPGPVR